MSGGAGGQADNKPASASSSAPLAAAATLHAAAPTRLTTAAAPTKPKPKPKRDKPLPPAALDAVAKALAAELDGAWRRALQAGAITDATGRVVPGGAAGSDSKAGSGSGSGSGDSAADGWAWFDVRRSTRVVYGHLTCSTLLKHLATATRLLPPPPPAAAPATATAAPVPVSTAKNAVAVSAGDAAVIAKWVTVLAAELAPRPALPAALFGVDSCTATAEPPTTTRAAPGPLQWADAVEAHASNGFLDFRLTERAMELLRRNPPNLQSPAAAPTAAASTPAPKALAAETAGGAAFAYSFAPIGVLRSCFGEKFGTPRQPSLCPNTRATLTLRHDLSADTLAGLDAYSHVWLLFVCHQNVRARRKRHADEAPGSDEEPSSASQSSSDEEDAGDNKANPSPQQQVIRFANAKVAPPRAGGAKVGVFATRSPHRPNPLALSVVALERVDSATKTLHLRSIDLVDGTPVLDIKPYHPADAVPDARLPLWVAAAYRPPPPVSATLSASSSAASPADSAAFTAASAAVDSRALAVSFRAAALSTLRALLETPDRTPLRFYESFADIRDAIQQVLQSDPRSIHSKVTALRQLSAAVAAAAATSSASAAVATSVVGVFGVQLDRLDVVFEVVTTFTPSDSVSVSALVAAATADSKQRRNRPISGTVAAPPTDAAALPAGVSERVEVVSIQYFADGSFRPRMRTANWLKSLRATTATSFSTSVSSASSASAPISPANKSK